MKLEKKQKRYLREIAQRKEQMDERDKMIREILALLGGPEEMRRIRTTDLKGLADIVCLDEHLHDSG